MLYECDKCKAQFPELGVGHDYEYVNHDPFTVRYFIVCPECGHDILNEIRTEDHGQD